MFLIFGLEVSKLNFLKSNIKGIILCLAIAVPAYFLGKIFPIVGGAVFAILIGMALTLIIKDKSAFQKGITFTSKKILQWAVILLGFGLNLSAVAQTGAQSLPIIVCTICVSLVISFVIYKILKMSSKTSILIGVGSSICGGSAIAAASSVIDADDEQVAQSISVIFLFNVIAAIVFPYLGSAIGFSTTDGEAFGIFAGTAVNDTSSVTACASTWDSMYNLGSATLDKAVTVKLTRTLAIIPITIVLALLKTKKEKTNAKVSFKKIFPFFILWFVAACVITTVCTSFFEIPAEFFNPLKELSKFLIVVAMAAIGLNTNIIKLVKTGSKPIFMGFCCWAGITAVGLAMQHILNIW